MGCKHAQIDAIDEGLNFIDDPVRESNILSQSVEMSNRGRG